MGKVNTDSGPVMYHTECSLPLSILITPLLDRYYDPHLLEEETEAQRGRISCLTHKKWQMQELNLLCLAPNAVFFLLHHAAFLMSMLTHMGSYISL